MGLGLIIDHFKIFYAEVKNALGRSQNLQFRGTFRRPAQLFLYQWRMVEIEMHVTTLPNQFTYLITANRGEHPREQGR